MGEIRFVGIGETSGYLVCKKKIVLPTVFIWLDDLERVSK